MHESLRRSALLLMLLAAAAFAERAPLPPGDHRRQLPHHGLERSYILHLPPAASGDSPLPLVLAFHGGGGNAAGFQEYAGLDAIADREGFAVAYPNGTGRPAFGDRLLTWNSGRCCGWALEQRADDVGFALAVLESAAKLARIDRARVYATGHSNGAMLAYRLAAEAADQIAAIVPVAGAMNVKKPFAPSRPVPVLHIHSVDDPRAVYAGGDRKSLGGVLIHHEPVLGALQLWEKRNGCSGQARQLERRAIPTPNGNGEQVAVHLAASCPEGAAIELWKLSGVGHGWPGDEPGPLPESVIGPHTNVISAAEEAWKFLARFQRTPAPLALRVLPARLSAVPRSPASKRPSLPS